MTPREALAAWFKGDDQPYNHADSIILHLRRNGLEITDRDTPIYQSAHSARQQAINEVQP